MSSVSLDPALLLVCLLNGSRTLAALLETGHFAVNVLHADQGTWPSASRAPGRAGRRIGGAGRTGVPLLPGRWPASNARCTISPTGAITASSSGRVLDIEHTTRETSPLLFYRSTYTTL